MKKLFCLLFLCIPVLLLGQGVSINKGKQLNTSEPSPWRVGGGMGLSLGNNNYLGIKIAPFVGYEISSNFEAGATIGYQYSKRTNTKQHLLNMGPYLNFYPIPEFFARVQYEYYRGTNKNRKTDNSYNFDENALWVGGGYRSTGRVQFYAGLMYDVLYKSKSRALSNGLRPIAGVSIGL